jgi:membrane protease YdiL (CAAX protease family)
MRRTTPRGLAVALALCLAGRAGAQSADLDQSAILATAGLSGLGQAATIVSCAWYDQPAFPYVFLGLATLQLTPALALGGADARTNLGVQLALDAAALGNAAWLGPNQASPLLTNFAHKWSMYASYDSYYGLRSRSADAAYRTSAPYGIAELALAPFDPANYREWYVWGYLGSMAAYAAVAALGADQSNAVWSTGRAYLGDESFPLWAGIPLMLALQTANFTATGIGEEALYRGVYYSEMKYRWGEWPAKIGDAAWFTASHLPQQRDKLSGYTLGQWALKLGLSAVQTFWLQYVYDQGGLKPAIAVHAANDVISFMVDWLVAGGVPNERGFSINQRSLSVTIPLR